MLSTTLSWTKAKRLFLALSAVFLLPSSLMAQRPLATSFQFPLDIAWTPSQQFDVWNDDWWGYHVAEDVPVRLSATITDTEIPVLAAGAGTVVHVGSHTGYGWVVIVEHTLPSGDPEGPTIQTLYAHMRKADIVSIGATVSKGAQIGYLSSKREENGGYRHTHLHFGIRSGAYNSSSCHPETRWWMYAGGSTLFAACNRPETKILVAPTDAEWPTYVGNHRRFVHEWRTPSLFILARLSVRTIVARPDTYAMAEGSSFAAPAPGVPGNAGILDNDDVPNDFQAVEFISAPVGLTVTNSQRGFFVFTPAPTFTGPVVFSYRMLTASGPSAPATVTIDVLPRPSATDDGPYRVDQGGQFALAAPGVLGNDTFPLGATVEFLAPLPAGFVGNADGSFFFDLSGQPAFTGPVALRYQIHSTNGDSNVASVTVSVAATSTAAVLYAQTDGTAVQSPVVNSTSYWIQTRVHTVNDPTWLVRKIVLPVSIADFSAFGVSQLTDTVCRHFDISFPQRGTIWNGSQNNISRPFGATPWQGVTVTADQAANTCTYSSDAGLVVLEAGFEYDLVPTSQSDLTALLLPVGSSGGGGHAGRFGHFTLGNNASPILSSDLREIAVVLCADVTCSPTFSRQASASNFTNPAGGWTVRADGMVMSMPLPAAWADRYVFYEGAFNTIPTDVDDWGNTPKHCYWGSGGSAAIAGNDFRTFFRRPLDLFYDFGLGTANCVAAGTYYVMLGDPSTRQNAHVYSVYWNGIPRSPANLYTNGLGFGNDPSGNPWNIWGAGASNVWHWTHDYVGGYLHYRFLVNNFSAGTYPGPERHHTVWSKDPATGFDVQDIVAQDVNLFPEGNLNNHTYQVDVQWSAAGYHVTVFDVTDGVQYSSQGYARPVTVATHDAWGPVTNWSTLAYVLYGFNPPSHPLGIVYFDEGAVDHAAQWRGTLPGQAATGTAGGGYDVRTNALPVVQPVP